MRQYSSVNVAFAVAATCARAPAIKLRMSSMSVAGSADLDRFPRTAGLRLAIGQPR